MHGAALLHRTHLWRALPPLHHVVTCQTLSLLCSPHCSHTGLLAVTGTYQGHTHPETFACAALSSWKAFPPDICMAYSFTSCKSHSDIISMGSSFLSLCKNYKVLPSTVPVSFRALLFFGTFIAVYHRAHFYLLSSVSRTRWHPMRARSFVLFPACPQYLDQCLINICSMNEWPEFFFFFRMARILEAPSCLLFLLTLVHDSFCLCLVSHLLWALP